MDNNTMNLNPSEPIPTTTSTNNEQQGYQSTTSTSDKLKRSTFLPIFRPPTSIIKLGVNDDLLLANVPSTYYLFNFVFNSYIYISIIDSHLAPQELLRRQQATNISETSIVTNIDDRHEPFCLSPKDIQELSTRLQVKESIITGNANRLRVICELLLALHEYFRRNILVRRDVALEHPTLNSKQMSLLLEFFLQIDGK